MLGDGTADTQTATRDQRVAALHAQLHETSPPLGCSGGCWGAARRVPAKSKVSHGRPRSIQHLLVDDVFANRLAVERAQNIARRLQSHAIEGFARDTGHMRGADD